MGNVSPINRNIISIPASSLEKLELELNKAPYESLPVGSALAQFFFIEFLDAKGEYSFPLYLRDVLSGIWSDIKPENRKPFAGKVPQGASVFSLTSNKRHFSELILPIASHFLNSGCILMTKDSQLQEETSSRFPDIIPWSGLPPIDTDKWETHFNQLKGKWISIINQCCDLPFLKKYYLRKRMINHITNQTRTYESIKLLLQKIKPSRVVVEFDKDLFNSCLVSAANHLGVKTFTLQHGVINSKLAYAPPIADKMIVWGDRYKEIFKAFGVEESRILIGGAPQMKKYDAPESNEVIRHRLNLDPGKKLVLFATNPCMDTDRLRLTSLFCEAIQGQHEYLGIIRIHPSEDISFYKQFSTKYDSIRLFDSTILSFADALLTPDIICVYNSAFSVDAMVNEKPLIVLNAGTGENTGHLQELIGQGKLPDAKSVEALQQLLTEFLNPETLRNAMEKQRSFIQKLVSSTGNIAAQKTAELIQNN